ncbi:MAG: helix-turn-helix domain-containing protein [Asgard group archaeon]|nr:helix-turn-helix domain-containing protein [Asgard group archaeon]
MIHINNDTLNAKHIRLLLAIQENPLGTYAELSERTGFTKYMVHNLLSDLESWGKDKKRCFTVVANLDLENLGLELVDVLVKASEEEQLQTLEKLCSEHPYTIYRGRVYGGDQLGLLIQFRQPVNSLNHLDDLLHQLLAKDLINDYEILPFTKVKSFYTTPNIDYWVPKNNTWKFNWHNWFKQTPRKVHLPQELEPSGKVKN